MNSQDREIIREILEGNPPPTPGQLLWWLGELVNRSITFSTFTPPEVFPPGLESVQPANGPKRLSDQKIQKMTGKTATVSRVDTSPERRWIDRALRLGRNLAEINVAFDGGITASRNGSCQFGRHKIEEGDDICKIEAVRENGDTATLWGCRNCWEAIVEDLDLTPEVTG
jgi:hypothetical protein